MARVKDSNKRMLWAPRLWAVAALAFWCLGTAGAQPADLEKAGRLYSAGFFTEAYGLLEKASAQADEPAKIVIVDHLVMMGLAEYFVKNYKNAYQCFFAAVKLSPGNQSAAQYFVRMRKEMDVAKLTNAQEGPLPAQTATPPVQIIEVAPARPEPTQEVTRLLHTIQKQQEKLVAISGGRGDEKEQKEIRSLLTEISRRQQEALDQKAVEEQGQDLKSLLARVDTLAQGQTQDSWSLSLILVVLGILLAVLCLVILWVVGRWLRLRKARPQTPGVVRAVEARPARPRSLLASAAQWRSGRLLHSRPADDGTDIAPREIRTILARLRAVTLGRDHSMATAKLAREMARVLELPPELQKGIFTAALVHDAGYLTLDPRGVKLIVKKNRRLTPNEFAFVKSHVAGGLEYFVGRELPGVIIDALEHHHERMDGSGYPRGLEGAAIPPVARILGAAETFVALVSRRSYRTQLTVAEAVNFLTHDARSEFDPAVVAGLGMAKAAEAEEEAVEEA